MKSSICGLIFFCSLGIYAQQAVDYDQIILDGKTAYINVKTGDIVKEKPIGLATSSSTAVPVSTNTTLANTSVSSHSVAKGETLYAISKKYGLSIAQLKALNPNIDINTLSIDQVITINKSANPDAAVATSNDNQSSTYSVEKGDTLYSISRRFKISVSELKNKNNLTSNVLSIGQRLIIRYAKL